MSVRSVLAILIACVAAYVGMAQPLVSPYPFAFPDGASITLPVQQQVEEAGKRGRIGVQNGHLVFSSGERIRLFGTTIQWSGTFPDSTMAMKMATRLRELGFNAVRFNTYDISWWGGGSIFADGTSTTALNPAQMRKFDWFIYQLKKNGIYVVLPMIGVFQPRADDGVRGYDSVGWGSRIPIFFNAALQRVVRNNVRMLLTHVNPFTNTAYKDETAIAYFVVTDENSLMNNWMYSKDVIRGNQYGSVNMGSQHIRMMDSLFNAYLRSLGYANTAAVQRAWSTTVADTSNIVRNGGFEDPFSGAWALAVATNEGAQALIQNSDADKVEGSTAMRIRIGKLPTPANAYMIQLYQNLPMVKRMHRYRISFYAKTTTQRNARNIGLYLYNNGYPYNSYGLSQTVALTSSWKRYEYTFTGTSTDSTSGALALQMGSDSGDVYLDDVRLQEVPYGGLEAGESLENNTIKRDPIWTDQSSPMRAKDQAGFMLKSMKDLFHSMKLLIRDTLKCTALIAPSTITVSYMEQAAAEELDVQCHSEYQGGARTILSNPNGGTLPSHSQARIAGKPFILNWIAVQFPRSYQNEVATYLPAYAGLQDWDGVFVSSFTDRPTSGATTIDSNMVWEIMNKPGVLSLLPSASRAFRSGAVSTSDKVVEISETTEALTYPRIHAPQLYSLSTFTDGRLPVFRRVETLLPPASTESLLPHREVSALAADMVDIRALDAENGQIFWNAQDAVLKVITPTYMSLSGVLNGQVIQVPNFLIEQTSTTPHTVISIASATDAPITEASKSLLTIATRQLNADATWKADNSDLATWGKGPISMEGVTVRFSISASADSMIVRPLSASGEPMTDVIRAARSGTGKFTFTINTQQYKTPWYQLELVRAATDVPEDGALAGSLSIAPNPVTDHCTIRWNGAQRSVQCVVTDMVGSTVLVHAIPMGSTDTVIDTSGLPAGTYLIRCGTQTLRMTKM